MKQVEVTMYLLEYVVSGYTLYLRHLGFVEDVPIRTFGSKAEAITMRDNLNRALLYFRGLESQKLKG